MTGLKITDPQLAATFDKATAPLAICGPEGKVFGYFSPAKPTLAHLQSPASEEEIRRRLTDPNEKWTPHDQVLALGAEAE